MAEHGWGFERLYRFQHFGYLCIIKKSASFHLIQNDMWAFNLFVDFLCLAVTARHKILTNRLKAHIQLDTKNQQID